MNLARHSATAAAESARRGEVTRLSPNSELINEVKYGEPLLSPDVFAAARTTDALRAFYERAHIISLAAFPLTDQSRVAGTVIFAATSRHEFARDEVEFLQLFDDTGVGRHPRVAPLPRT